MSLDLSAMTLADAEALAARLETAARTIRDALSMMGGPATVTVASQWTAAPAAPSGALTATPTPPAPMSILMTNKGPVRLTDAEQAQRDALRREREAEEFEADRKKLAGT